MSLPYDKKLIPLAKKLRMDATPQERRLWYDFLKDYPLRFQRQKVIGSYIVDFYCHASRLVIELDGDQHGEPEHHRRDALRTKELEALGLRVLRFANREIDESLEAVCHSINRAARERLPSSTSADVPFPYTEFDD